MNAHYTKIPDTFSPKRILVCQLRQIGDVLLTTPSIALLAKKWPGAEIHVFTEKKCVPILEKNPHIHTIWPVDKKKYNNLLKELIWYKKVAAQKFDLIIDFQQLPRCRWVVGMSRSALRVGTTSNWYTNWLYSFIAPKPQQSMYSAAYKAFALEPLGIHWAGEKPELYLTKEERKEASVLLSTLLPQEKTDAPFISMDISHRQKTRRWPARYYAQLIDMIVDCRQDLYFFLPYGPGEEKDILKVKQASRHPERFLIPSAVISLRAMAACMEKAVLHVGNCSAPRHMAVALGVPSFTILGATSPGWTFPSPEHTHIAAGLPCQPCNKNDCPIIERCLTELLPDNVFPAVMKHMDQFHPIKLVGKSINDKA